MKSTSCSVFGPPRAHAARPPASACGTPASRRIALACRADSTSRSNSSSFATAASYPGLNAPNPGQISGVDPAKRTIRIAEAGGIVVLDRDSAIEEVDGIDVGIVGTKGFVGGFAGSSLPDFGEPLLRRLYAETSAEVEALERGPRRSPTVRCGSCSCTTRPS